MNYEEKLDAALRLVRAEALRAVAKHGELRSAHELWGVLAEELDELMDEMRANCREQFNEEAIQCAAVLVRALVDL